MRQKPGGVVAVMFTLLPAFLLPCGSAWTQETETHQGMHGPQHGHDAHFDNGTSTGGEGYSLKLAGYVPPDVALIDTRRDHHQFQRALHGSERPLILQFIYTTCPGVCPLLSSLIADLESASDPSVAMFRRWSISIDPEHDTPERLDEYALTFGTVADWSLMTGASDDIDALRKSFDVYQYNKMDHEPTTFVWPGRGDTWLRLDGFPTAEELLAEAQHFVEQFGH